MRRLTAFWLIALAVMSVPGSDAEAGGNMRSEGDSDFSLGLTMDVADRIYDKSGTAVSGLDCSANPTISLYGEHGLSYYTTVFGSTSVHDINCAFQSGPGMGNSEIGLRRRINPIRDEWVWEAGLVIPTSKIGSKKASDSDAFGWNLELHWNPKPNPYDLTIDKDYFAPNWGAGVGLHGWFAGLPGEASAYVAYRKQIRLADWLRDSPGVGISAELSTARSIMRTRASNKPAVDRNDSFEIYSAVFGLSYQLSKRESLRVSLRSDFAGKNQSDNSGITFSYGRTLPR